MKHILYKIVPTIKKIFAGRNLVWQGAFIIFTTVIVFSGFDWWYYTTTRNTALQIIGFSAGMLGFLVPVLFSAILLSSKNAKRKIVGAATAQAGLLGLAISSLYKVFTGRVGLPHIANAIDISHVFQFGVLRGGAFQGWPSSHTSVAFAMSLALITLFPGNKKLKFWALAYAFFIGIGASVAFHWFSDFFAGIILGTIIGITVGNAFKEKLTNAA
jgi:membrane-associated phospholipid phosphatase